MTKKVLFVTGAVLASPLFAFAQEFGTSSAQTAIDTFMSSIGGILIYAVPIILGSVAGLIGLGWAVRKFIRYVSGKKF